MKKLIAALVALATVAAFADYTPVLKESTATGVVLPSAEVNGDITLANDETLDNAVDGVIRATFNDDGTTLGTVKLTSENVYTNVADNDVIEIVAQAANDSNEVIDYATIQYKLLDVTTNTEDGAIVLQVQVGGTETTIATVDASGVTLPTGKNLIVGANTLTTSDLLDATKLSGNIPVARIATALTTPGAIGGTTPAAGAFTTITGSGALTLTGAATNVLTAAAAGAAPTNSLSGSLAITINGTSYWIGLYPVND
jgi:hypothetical protein